MIIIQSNKYKKKNKIMDAKSKRLIEDILKELGLKCDCFVDHYRPACKVIANKNCICLNNVWFNIPDNKTFVFQLIFEDETIKIADEVAICLKKLYGDPYIVGGSSKAGYKTIYLPNDSKIEINTTNRGLIKNIISSEMDKVCKVFTVCDRLCVG